MHPTLRRLAFLAAGALAAATVAAQTPTPAATPASPAVPAAPATASAPAATAPQAGDAALVQRGKRLFLRCAACHDATPTGLPKTGPHLQGIVGRRAGAVEGYAYSPAMKAQNFQWDVARLEAWLTQPGAVVPSTSMVFIGMPDAEERRALIAFLRTLK